MEHYIFLDDVKILHSRSNPMKVTLAKNSLKYCPLLCLSSRLNRENLLHSIKKCPRMNDAGMLALEISSIAVLQWNLT